ncbi:uncharacterized protein LOC144420961 [Styela clava]
MEYNLAKTEKPISFKLSNDGLTCAKNLMQSVELPEDIVKILKSAIDIATIDLLELIKVFEWRCLQHDNNKNDTEVPNLFPLLRDACMFIPNLPEKEPNPELQKRLKKLSAQQKHRDYNKMVENVSRKPCIAKLKRTGSSLISGLNFALTLFASCGATMYLLQSYIPDLAFRAGIGLVIGTVILVIEIYLAAKEIEKQTEIGKKQ